MFLQKQNKYFFPTKCNQLLRKYHNLGYSESNSIASNSYGGQGVVSPKNSDTMNENPVTQTCVTYLLIFITRRVKKEILGNKNDRGVNLLMIFFRYMSGGWQKFYNIAAPRSPCKSDRRYLFTQQVFMVKFREVINLTTRNTSNHYKEKRDN